MDSDGVCGQSLFIANIQQQIEGHFAGNKNHRTDRCFGLRDPPLLDHPESAALLHQVRYVSSIVLQELQ